MLKIRYSTRRWKLLALAGLSVIVGATLTLPVLPSATFLWQARHPVRADTFVPFNSRPSTTSPSSIESA